MATKVAKPKLGSQATWDGKRWVRETVRQAWLELVVLTERGEFRQELVGVPPTMRSAMDVLLSGASMSVAALTAGRLALKAGLKTPPSGNGAKRSRSSTAPTRARSARKKPSRRG